MPKTLRKTRQRASGAEQSATLADFQPDPRNANKGTERGSGFIEKSLRQYGAGRSILVDRNNKIIAGNKTSEGAASIGLEKVRVVDTDGTELVVVRRTDLDLDSKAARELAIADNRAGQISLEWDVPQLESLAEDFGIDLKDVGFGDGEIGAMGGTPVSGDPNAEWQGMPEFQHEDKTAFKSLTLHFKDQEAVEKFAELVGQKITESTRFLWFPQIEIESYADKRYAE